MLAEGDSFGKYKVERMLGRGGMGVVYLVRHELLESEFALKVLAPEVAETRPDFVKRFLREAKLASRIRHPNLVAVYDAGRDEATGLYYLVMDYVSGGSLRDRLAWSLNPTSVDEAIRITREIASALAEAEKHQMVHRDVKPENVMFDAADHARLADLGLAKAANERDSLVTAPEDVFGTPSYMSPEQIEDSSGVDARADVYSLGVVLFEMLAGRRPYEGETALNVISKVLSQQPLPDVQEFAPTVPKGLAELVRDMCAKKREKRIQSATEVISRLDEIAKVNTNGSEPPRKQGKPRRGLWLGVGGLLIAVLGALAAMTLKNRNEPGAQQSSEPSVTVVETKRTDAAEAAEAESKRRDEEKRVEEEKRQAEEKRLADEREKLIADRKRLDEAKAKLDAENKRIATEEAARREKEIADRKAAAEKAKREAEAAEQKRAAEARAKLEAEAKAKREAEEKAKHDKEIADKAAAEKAKREAEAAEQKRAAEAKAKLEAEAKAKREAEEKAKRDKEIADKAAADKAKREAAKPKKHEFIWNVSVTCRGDDELAALRKALNESDKAFETSNENVVTLNEGGLFSEKETKVSWRMRMETTDARTPEARRIVVDFLTSKCATEKSVNWNDLGRVYAEQDFATAIRRPADGKN